MIVGMYSAALSSISVAACYVSAGNQEVALV